HLRDTKNNPGRMPDLIAQNRTKTPGVQAGRNIVRLTVPPAQPFDPEPVVRGAMPEGGQQSVWVPVYPPTANQLPPATPPAASPVIPTAPPSPVRLGPPQTGPAPVNPVGYPR